MSSTSLQPGEPDRRKIVTVVVVGQVPPPINGQSLMIREFLNGTYPHLRLIHVPMEFSRSTAEIGAFGLRKVLHLGGVLAGIWMARMRSGATVLYYPPAGANLNPVLRDMFLLIPSRWLFRYTVFHFHAAGLSKIYPRLPRALKLLFDLAYQEPDLAIFTTRLTSSEADALQARSTAIVPCGAADPMAVFPGWHRVFAPGAAPTILFAGILCEGKGVETLVKAATELDAQGVPFRMVAIGAFQDAAFERQIRGYLAAHGLSDRVTFPGVLTGTAKHEAFAAADIFCFPSHYPAESFGVVLVEAMSYSLPIVATEWQGIPEVTGADSGSTLVPVKDPVRLADALLPLLQSSERREALGALNRARYLQRFTLETYRRTLAERIRSLPVTSPKRD